MRLMYWYKYLPLPALSNFVRDCVVQPLFFSSLYSLLLALGSHYRIVVPSSISAPVSMLFDGFFMVQCVVVLAIVYIVYTVIYRLYFHPLARFPGPKLAAITYWYEFYYDIVRRGQYTFKLRELHEKYGEFAQSIGEFG